MGTVHPKKWAEYETEKKKVTPSTTLEPKRQRLTTEFGHLKLRVKTVNLTYAEIEDACVELVTKIHCQINN